ncbi:Motility protein B [Fundidesulfovibrio magnetotacticus]|uniref:Motility protein B n=1 Tax=Fundidesulfovibrio magnetotacticus TaxID=2730080 RepID=A0A6V8LPW6_9BACT|nr:OmpA family protein [Fundidesulfovibrio magnetotacticus]GFK92591.1 Motility protein B [Fundidesulfovibrio magnetotacticus]
MLMFQKLRGRFKDEDEGTWFISLADLLTLLLCFFVVMLSVSSVDQDRYRKVAQSMEAALAAEKAKRQALAERQPDRPMGSSLHPEPVPDGQYYPVIQPPLPPQVYQSVGDPVAGPGQGDGPGPTARLKTLDEIESEMSVRFAKDPAGIQVEKRQGGVAITLKGAVLFQSGSADLAPSSRPYLDSIAQSLRATPYRVTVEGHTDNLPIQSFLFPSNWELSAARASRVARYLIDHGVPRDRIQIAGFAETRPVAPNENAQGQPLPDNQARNRRVVVQINP